MSGSGSGAAGGVGVSGASRGGLRGGASAGGANGAGRGGASAGGSGAAAGSGGSGKSLLAGFLHKRVTVLTNDGRVLTGKLLGFDQVSNLVVGGCAERVFCEEKGVEEVERGVQVLRGDCVAAVGEVEEGNTVKWGEIRVSFCGQHPPNWALDSASG